MKKVFRLTVAFLLVLNSGVSIAQGLLNKVKNKTAQELNKLESGANNTTSATPNKNILSANVTRTVVLTLSSDENFDYQESCINLGSSLNQISFILNKRVNNGMQCYAYKNGTRTPVPCPTANSGCQTALQCSYSKLRTLEQGSDEMKKYITEKTSTNKAPGMTDEQLKQMSAYMTKEQMDEVKKAMKQASEQSYKMVESVTINFHGKSYGPYKMIQSFLLTPDGTHFYAVVNDGGTDNKIISSASAAVITTQLAPMSVIAAPDNSEFAMFGIGMDSQYSIITSSGKTYKVNDPGWFHGAWYSASGNHMITYAKDVVSIDGKAVKTFAPNTSYDPCDLFVSSDAKGIAVVKDNTISFPDGDYFQYPLKMALINAGGKVYFKWLALEDRQVVMYQKPF